MRVLVTEVLGDPGDGADPETYFREHYAELAYDPAAYGFYQFTMVLEAWEARADTSFRGELSALGLVD